MKLVTFAESGFIGKIGVLVRNDLIADLQSGALAMDGKESCFFYDMVTFLRNGKEARDKATSVLSHIAKNNLEKSLISVDRAHLMAPVPLPASIRDCMCFEQHIINASRVVGLKKLAFIDEFLERILGRRRTIAYNANREWYKRPLYYKSNRFSVVGTGADVIIPAYTEKMDYELEFGIFISKQGVNIPVAEAHEYIGGYTIFNDFSARDIQLAEMKGRLGPSKGKDFDTGNVMGPCLTTPDEIVNPYNLEMIARVNGEEWSHGNSKDMQWTFEQVISYISKTETLYPGEFIGSGTCSGITCRGCGLEMNKFLKKGDVVEIEVQGIGIIKNRLV